LIFPRPAGASGGACSMSMEPSEGERTIHLERGQAREATTPFPINGVKTSKYTACNFLPKNLWEQLQKFGNCYFLCISVVMYLGEKTPLFVGTIKAFSTLGLLVTMMAVTAAMALYDDIQRKRADNEINNAKATVIRKGGKEATVTFQDIQVGDVVLVHKDEEFAADTVPLYCSGEGGNCYVSTANLDGETNLKLKTAKEETQKALEPDPRRLVEQLDVAIGAEEPNGNIHDFNGNLTVGGRQAVSLGPQQLLMRGTVLRNTKFCIGVVIYTGPDTRMVRNSRPPPMKQSNLEVTTNQSMKYILCIQALIALASAWCHTLMKPMHHWYLEEEQTYLPELVAWWFTFFTLYSNLMPISLYPTVEFCNAFQCQNIEKDKMMEYEQKGFNEGRPFPAKTRSSNLCQELGQVGYIFSDKTGTLTQNDMELRRMSINGQKYGTFQTSHQAEKVDAEVVDGFNGSQELQAARSSPQMAGAIDSFLEVLAVSHTVMVTDGEDGRPAYEAESPDEFALVEAARSQGWEFKSRRGPELMVTYSSPGARPRDVQYRVLATNAFNSARKRMSVLVQKGSEHLLLVKGADNVMLERASSPQKPLEADLMEFSEQGLRTLVLGQRSLRPDEVSAWLARYEEAQRATTNRDLKLEQVAEEVEKSLTILGATGIEDKLQDGVPETIERIRQAGIKLWVLTGDKLETARNIGFSTRVLTSAMDIQILDADSTMDITEKLASIEERWWKPAVSTEDEEAPSGRRLLDFSCPSVDDVPDADSSSNRALMVTGKALTQIWEREEKDLFKRISTSCSVLIACRVSPSQKAELVQFIRDMVVPTPVTLSVGDGANDVPMIQTAQVGVGIAGKEGRQAVNNSDFAIAQFRYLERLLLLHGRWNYRRACMFTLFTFWRNMVQVLMIVCYTFISGFSGTSIYEDWIRLTFNALCTLPILPPGCQDEDLKEKEVLRRPWLYQVGPQSEDLNPKKTFLTLSVALLHALVLLLVTVFAFPGLEAIGAGDYYTFGTICYTCLIIDVNYRAIFLTHNAKVRWWTAIAAVISFVMYVIWLLVYPCVKWVTELLTPNMFMVPEHMIRHNAYFYIMICVIPLTVLVYDMFFHWLFHRIINPDVSDKVMHELEEAEEKRSAGACGNCESTDEDVSASESQKLMYSDNDEDSAEREWCVIPFVARRPYHIKVSCCGCVGGIILLLTGGMCLHFSESYQQVRISYSDAGHRGKNTSSWLEAFFVQYPIGTRDDEKFFVSGTDCVTLPDGKAKNCTITVVPKRDLAGSKEYPLMLLYTVGPIYQNYNAYMKSEVIQELYGQWDEDKEMDRLQNLRQSRCPNKTREVKDDATGSLLQLVPCGMKAQSLFNDSFQVLGHPINYHHVAWTSDVDRYSNPKFEGKDWSWQEAEKYESKIRWLFQAFDVVNKTQNVKDERFVSWMRPSAVPRVWNRVGFLPENLKKDKEIKINILSQWDVSSIPGGYKSLVITQHGMFGTRHNGFSYVLMCCGFVSFLMAVAVLPLRLLRPSPDYAPCSTNSE